MDWEAWNREQAKRIADYERAVLEVYKRAISSVSAMYASFPDIDPDKPFSFDDYPEVRERARKVFRKMHDDIDKVIINGVEAQWTLANNRNNELSNIVFGGLELSSSMRRRYYADNSVALETFKKRKSAGLGISDRVWKYTRQYKSEIEAALWVGIGNGVSAQEMSRMLRDYLQYPDKLFRRVRDEFGELRLSKAAKEFNPGRGVYRSSYKNARRLAATETNMAYRTADFLRWQQMDYVVGIEIRLSNNHTLNGRPFKDICDELAGFYPKSFKFTGWHPLCRCYQVPVLKTDKELAEDALRIADGREPSVTSNNEVKDIPPQFKEWLEKNNDRISHAKSLPYFLRENSIYMKGIALKKDAVSQIRESASQDYSVREIKPICKANTYFSVYKEYTNGGVIQLMDGIDKSASDYKALLTIAREFAMTGKTVQITRSVHYKDELYESVFGKLKGTIYEKKCPDLIVDGLFYEYESYTSPWKKRKISNMLSHGLRQSDRIIINNNKGCSDRYIINNILRRANDKFFKGKIKEVLVYEKGRIRKIFPKKSGREQ